MFDLDDLRRQRQEAATAMETAAVAISDLEGQEVAVDAEEMIAAVAGFENAQAEFAKANLAVQRAEAVEAAQVASATNGDETGGTQTPAPVASNPAQPTNPEHVGIEAGFMLHALANNRGDRTQAAASLEAAGHSGIAAALSGASESAGGVTIPQAQAASIISLLRPRVVVRASGARTAPMPAGEMRRARQTGGATASYGSENSPIGVTEPTFDKVDSAFKKLTAMVGIGNSLLRHTNITMAGFVRDDMVTALATTEDLAFLRFDGTGSNPKGLRHWVLPAHWQAGVLATVDAVDKALRKAVSLVEDSDVAMVAPGWIMRASAKSFLASLRDANGQLVYPTIDASNTLGGFPIKTTSQIPNNLGVGGDETEITFADFNEIVIGDSMVITLASSTEAAYVDGSGDTVSAFQNDLTLMRAISEHDIAPLHDVAIAGFNAVGWSL